MEDIPITMITTGCKVARVDGDKIGKLSSRECLIIANKPDDTVTVSVREGDGIIVSVSFEALATAIANELNREVNDGAGEEDSADGGVVEGDSSDGGSNGDRDV